MVAYNLSGEVVAPAYLVLSPEKGAVSSWDVGIPAHTSVIWQGMFASAVDGH